MYLYYDVCVIVFDMLQKLYAHTLQLAVYSPLVFALFKFYSLHKGTVIIQNQYFILFPAAKSPFLPVNVTTTVTRTTATITFIIRAIAYTPEIYYIQYIGLELQNVLSSSTAVTGPDDITIINATYSITLSGLQEANTYEFTVVSTNCIGNVTTEVMDFTTLPACKRYYDHFH